MVCIRFLDPATADVTTRFLAITDLPNQKSETIEIAILDILVVKKIPLQKVIGLGTDGAANMTGRKSGLVARLNERNLYLTGHHCSSHRLNLASSQAAEKVPYLKKMKSILMQLFKLYSDSCVRQAGLPEIQKILDDPQLRLKNAVDTRWLSQYAAVSTIRRIMPSLITSLERGGSERGDATAAGLATFVKAFHLQAAIHLLPVVLLVLTYLSKVLQGKKLDFPTVQPCVNGAVSTLQQMRDNPGLHM